MRIAAAAEGLVTRVPLLADLDGNYLRGRFLCSSTERDPTHSKPDEAAWLLKCENATYRVRLIPDMAAVVERLN